jgi:hypothetical protein
MESVAETAVNPRATRLPPAQRSAVTNGKRLHAVRPGDTVWSRRFRDVLAQIIADIGGPDGLSEGQRQLARRAATLALECERLELRAVSGKSMLDQELTQGNGLTPVQILLEASRVLHALGRHEMGGGVAALAAKPRDERDYVVDLLMKASDIAAKAATAGGEVIDLETYGVLCDRLNRVFMRLGLERKAREIGEIATPEYLRALQASPAPSLPSEDGADE